MRHKYVFRLIATLVLLAAALQAQVGTLRIQDTILLTVSGSTGVLNDPLGTTTDTFEFVITGTPTTSSLVVQGCMRGGTCDTLDTYTGTGNIVKGYQGGKDYDNYKFTWTFTGGSSPTLRVNWTGSAGVAGGQLLADCPNTSFITGLGAATAKIITGVAGRKIRVCSMHAINTNATGTQLSLTEGTGTNCGTGTTAFTGKLMTMVASTLSQPQPNFSVASGPTTLTQGDDVCVVGSAAGAVDVTMTWVAF